MRTPLALGTAALVLMLSLAGCSGSSTSAGDDAPTSGSNTAAESSAAPEASEAETAPVLATADTAVGTVVVDTAGMTVYMFDKDTMGAASSACTGECLTKWPPVLVDADELAAAGVTGTLGTIDTPEGAKQLTLNGWPLYTFAGDSTAGDVAGQGVNDVWWVLTPAGEKFSG